MLVLLLIADIEYNQQIYPVSSIIIQVNTNTLVHDFQPEDHLKCVVLSVQYKICWGDKKAGNVVWLPLFQDSGCLGQLQQQQRWLLVIGRAFTLAFQPPPPQQQPGQDISGSTVKFNVLVFWDTPLPPPSANKPALTDIPTLCLDFYSLLTSIKTPFPKPHLPVSDGKVPI